MGFLTITVSSFDVNSDGTILNNSASNGTAQLKITHIATVKVTKKTRR